MGTGAPDSVDEARSALSEAPSADASSARSRVLTDVGPETVAPLVRRSRPWLRRVGLGLLVGALAAAVVPIAVVAPYVRDDLKLDRVVRAVALDWRDFGQEKALTRLEYELDHQGIGMAVGDDDCGLVVEGEVRRVSCAWGVVIAIPGTDLSVPLAFASTAEVAADGSLR